MDSKLRFSLGLMLVVAVASVTAIVEAGRTEKGKHAKEAVPVRKEAGGYECPLGWTLEGDLCTQTHAVDYMLKCDHGGHPRGTECYQYTDLVYKCPAGFHAEKKMHLNTRHHKDHDNKDNYVPPPTKKGEAVKHHHHDHHDKEKHHEKEEKHGYCHRVQFHAGIDTCPDGSQHDHKVDCLFETRYAPSSHCPHKSSKMGPIGKESGCVESREVEPLPQCPKGMVFDNGLCSGMEKYPCKKQVLCVGFGCAGHEKGHHKGHPTKKLRSLLPQDDEAAPSMRSLVGEKVKKVVKDVVHGGKEVEQCERLVYREPEWVCPGDKNGGHKRKKCFMDMQVPYVHECGKDDEYDPVTHECIERKKEKRREVCPVGYDFCKGVKSWDFDFVDGRKLSADNDKRLKGSPLCCKDEFADPFPYCQAGFSLEGQHCARRFAAIRKCPEGFHDSGTNCVKQLRKRPNHVYNVVMCEGKNCESHHDKKHL
eukprot:GHVQ01028049.1.p1 GENE.GHVQ01028049.1~~GHVQ01028049.1.p1  ORF type:complete len:478 (-),score=60.03 GHVQ01028049.1:364-1797(-)